MTPARPEPDDPYAPRPTLWQRHPLLGWPLAVAALTVLLANACFPPLNIGEAAYVFAVPAVLWAYRGPAFRLYARTVLLAQAVAWTILLGWLHNVTWAGLVLLGPFIGALIGSWYLAVWWVMPRLRGRGAPFRIAVMLGLAALWVLLEWVRGWILGGFPWLPLAASQWQRPLVLQPASYAGAWSVSFVLVLFNLGVAAYAHRIFFEGATGLKKRSPEFMTALFFLVFSTFPTLTEVMGQQRARLLRVAFVQPAIPQLQKWDQALASETMRVIEKTTQDAVVFGEPDLVVWPEAVTPWVLHKDPNVQPWLESVAKKAARPVLLGVVSAQHDAVDRLVWSNGVVLVDPVKGLQPAAYVKRKLVPFGEYVPLRPVLGWIEKFAPIGGDFTPGATAAPIPVPAGRVTVPVGALVCYEDIFPQLARASVLAGAELLAVQTNNGWFGTGGAAYQHAAHSVLRAVENRRPVIRCGNAGWSGWIDEYGNIRGVLTGEDGTVYFRGSATHVITRDLRWHGQQTFYTLHGDWFLLVCAGLAALAGWMATAFPPPPARTGAEPVF